MEVVRYKEQYKAVWDLFVVRSKNGTFLFLRDYMEYHADRFSDHSLLIYRKGKLVALLPANETGAELQSHRGLSYGGIICAATMKASVMLQVFEEVVRYLKAAGFKKLTYKATPHIYHQSPAEEDLYALYKAGAVLVRRDLNSVISLKQALPYSKLRKRTLKIARLNDLQLRRSFEFGEFMQMEQKLLQEKYKLSPTHSLEEIISLAQQFPDNIKLFTASYSGEMVAGILIYETEMVAHCQYIGTTVNGKKLNALDVLINYLLTEVYSTKVYFSFGVSTEQQGMHLNENLVRNKESYGARTVVHDFYELQL